MAEIYGTYGHDTLVGTSGDDFIYGNEGDDTLSGLGGNDWLIGSAGADVMNGGDGADRIDFDFTDNAIDIATGGGGADRFEFGIFSNTSRLPAIDRITDFSSAQGDRLDIGVFDGTTGGSRYLRWAGAVTTPGFSLTAGQALTGGVAGISDVWTWSSGGMTWLIVDKNDDEVLDNFDFVIAFDGTPALGTDAFVAGTFVAQFGTLGNDAATLEAGADLYFAIDGDDTANGAGGDDRLYGGEGGDTLNGGDGADLLVGETGNDVLRGGADNDTLYAGMESNTNRDDTGTVNELYGEDGDDSLVAREGHDLLDGGIGADLLNSQEDDRATGGDTLLGGDGDDVITFNGDLLVDGGAGADTFNFGRFATTVTLGTGADTLRLIQTGYQGNFSLGEFHLVTDFNQAEGDRLDFGLAGHYPQKLIFRGALDNPAFSLQAGQAFSSSDYGSDLAQIWTWASGGQTFLIADLDGSGTLTNADYVIRFSGALTLTQDGFAPGALITSAGGTAASDVIQGTEAYDVIYGLSGDDVIHGVGGHDLLFGNSGDDEIHGGTGATEIFGGDGDDLLYGGVGGVVNGGAGSDIIYGGGGSLNAGSSGPDGLDDIDLIYGSGYGENISGGRGALDQSFGYGGDDNISGGGLVDGGDGADQLSSFGARAATTLLGGAGNDSLYSGDFGDLLIGGAGVDSFQGGGGDDEIVGTFGDSWMYGDGGDDILRVSGQAPAGSLPQTLSGGEGVDLVDFSGATAFLTVDLSNPYEQNTGGGTISLTGIENAIASGAGSNITGTTGANRLEGRAGADRLDGGLGDDVLRGGAGSDQLIGGAGVDVADYSQAAGAVTAGLAAGSAANDGDGASDTLSGIENLTGSAFNDVLGGNGANNRLAGGAGNDSLEGLNGDDVLVGGAGVDVLTGGAGIDTADYSTAAAGMRAQLNTNVSSNDGDGGTDTFSGIENLTGSAFNDTLIGDGVVNVLRGDLGSDTLIGLGGNDVLWGGAGAANTVAGGLGDDWYVLEANDSVVEAGEGNDTVEARINTYVLAANVETLIFTGTGDFFATGHNGASTITGGAGDDNLRGRGGVDVLNGGAGIDTVDYGLAASGVTARLDQMRATNDGDGSTDTFSGIENLTGSIYDDVLLGNGANNVLMGGVGVDVLAGYAGNDVLYGGPAGGNNQLIGGLGDDWYVLDAIDTCVELAGEGIDTVEARIGAYVMRANIENLIYTGSTQFVGTGNALDNHITGGARDDYLRGMGGNDTILGGLGTDELQVRGSMAQYTVTAEGSGWRVIDTVGGRDGSIYVESIELIRFLSGNTTTALTYPPAAPAPLETGGKETAPEILPGLLDDTSWADAFVLPAVPDDQPMVLPGLEADKFTDAPLVLPGTEQAAPHLFGLLAHLPPAGDWMISLDPDGFVGGPADHDRGWHF